MLVASVDQQLGPPRLSVRSLRTYSGYINVGETKRLQNGTSFCFPRSQLPETKLK